MSCMITVQQVITLMEQLAPHSYAESWDNVGLMVGDRNVVVTGVVTTLDVTEETVEYAIEQNCNLIVSHHPLIFKGLKQISCDTAQGRTINKLIQHKIAVYSAHTNLDIAPGGLNDMLAKQLGLIDIKGFIKTGEEALYKVTTFVPESSADAVRLAMGDAGAGRIGNYEHCSFSIHGEGRFVGNEDSHPVIGAAGALTVVPEVQVNAIVDGTHLSKVVAAMKAAHPYEEPAYDIYQIDNLAEKYGIGRVGELKEAMPTEDFIEKVKNAFDLEGLRVVYPHKTKETIKRVAICGGSGEKFYREAVAAKADVYITGDVYYHTAHDMQETGMLVIDPGHYIESLCKEKMVDLFNQWKNEEDWKVDFFVSETSTNPFSFK